MEPNPSGDLPKIPVIKKSKTKFIAILAAFFVVFIAFAAYLKLSFPTTSPLTSASYFVDDLSRPHAEMTKKVIGFLPYWRLDDTKYLQFDLLSEIIYFSLTADENGEIVKVTNKETDPGWRWWNSSTIKDLVAKTQIAGGKFSVTIAMQKNKTLESFLDNKIAQKTLIDNMLSIVKTSKLDGVNVDFEYDGEPGESYQQKFTEFSRDLVTEFRTKSPKTELSIDFFPLSLRKPRLYNVAELSPLFDRVIVMSYDYYSTSSDLSGPVAPMGGFKEGKYFFDVITTYEDYLKVVPKEKLIMGVPYYGWDFPVEDGTTPLSKVLDLGDENGYPEVISYGRAKLIVI